MMATVQNCLITSFFKSPPKEEAVISERPASAKCSSPPVSTATLLETKGDTESTESQISPGNTSKGISSDKCQEAVQSDLISLDDYDSDHDDGNTSDEGDFVKKPLVINLTGLLSPEIMHKNFVPMATNEDKKQRKISEMCACLTDRGQKSSTQDVKVLEEMTSSVEHSLQMHKSGPKEPNSDTSMDCMADDSNRKQTVSSQITDSIQECAKCPQQVSTSLKQSVLSWDGRSSQLVLGMPVGHASLELEEEGESGKKEEQKVSSEAVDKLGRTAVCGSNREIGGSSCEGGVRVANGRGGGRKRKYKIREDSLDALVDCDGGEAPAKSDPVVFEENTREGEKLDDSFEDFIEARRQRTKRRRRSHCSTQLGKTESCIDSSEEEIKRPRRSAAVSAAKKILATMPQKIEKPSQNTPESSSDEAFLSLTSKPKTANAVNMDSDCGNKTGDVECVYESESLVVTASADTAANVENTVDDSVIIMSTSPQKPSYVSPQKRVNKGGLSAEWAEIFKRTSNQTNGVIELVTTEDEGSPKPSRRLQGLVSTRSPKKYRSSSRSPRRCSSPRRSAPHRSPAQQNSRKLTFSPLKQSHTSRKQLSFSAPITTSCRDNAPFAGLVHVQQRDPEEQLWNLEASQSILSSCQPLISLSRAPLVQHPLLDLSAATLERPTLGLMTSVPQETRRLSPPQVCSDTERLQILTQLQKVYPDRDINGIYSHYSRIASLLTSTDQSDPPSSSEPVRNAPQKLLRTKRKIRTHKGVGESLKYSIQICNPTNGAVKNDNGKKICVDVAAYENAKISSVCRRSQRLSKEMQRPTSKMSLKCSIRICNPANGEVRNRNNTNKKICVDVAAYENAGRLAPPRKSQRLSKKKEESTPCKEISEQSQPLGETSSFDQASASFCKPGVFGSELWTEIYRPQKASEVIGNSVQVRELSDWLREWKGRCTSQRESASVSNVSESRRGNSIKKRGEGASRVSCSRESSSTQSSIPLWVSEEDGDFVSLAHLRRRHCVRGPRFPDSSDTDGESSGGEEGLCPVTLLCGDHGSGKTAAVYACAQELGYKVFEVNSTSVRSRQNILAILREATLSHQVATTHPHHNGGTKSGPITSFFSKPISNSSLPASRTSSEKKTTSAKPSGICAFFKPKQSQKKGPGSKDRDEESDKESVQLKVKRKKRRSGTDPTIIIGSSSEGELVAPTEHAQSGASVALATATVILLEEVDILFEEERGFWSAVYELIATTKRPIIMTCNDSRYELECDHQKLIFSQPSLSELSLHMQLLCLSHGAHLAPEVTNQITAFLKCDIRKMVTLLHFWLSLLLPSRDSETTAVMLRGESCGNHQPKSDPLGGGRREKEEEEERDSDIAPLSLEHLFGLSAVQRKVLKRVSMATATTGGAHCSKSQYGAMLSEAVTMVHQEGLELTHSLGDGPPSCQGNPPLCSKAFSVEGDTVPSPETQDTSSGQVEPEKLCFFTVPWKESHRAKRTTPNYLRLDSVSNMCDTLSCMDTVAMESCDSHMTESNCFSPWWCSIPEMSLSDELPLASKDSCSMELSGSVRAMMRALAMQEQWRCWDSWGSSQGDPYGLLVAVEQKRRVQAMHSTCVECANAFGLHWELSHVAMVTDGLPALQLMCHSENLRETANTQRRFRHYLAASTVALQDLKSLPRMAAFYP